MRKANAWVGQSPFVFAYTNSIYQACPRSLVNTTIVRGSGEVKRESDGTYEVRARRCSTTEPSGGWRRCFPWADVLASTGVDKLRGQQRIGKQTNVLVDRIPGATGAHGNSLLAVNPHQASPPSRLSPNSLTSANAGRSALLNSGTDIYHQRTAGPLSYTHRAIYHQHNQAAQRYRVRRDFAIADALGAIAR